MKANYIAYEFFLTNVFLFSRNIALPHIERFIKLSKIRKYKRTKLVFMKAPII